MVSRIHVADIARVIEASIERPDPGLVVNVADDLPATRYEVHKHDVNTGLWRKAREQYSSYGVSSDGGGVWFLAETTI